MSQARGRTRDDGLPDGRDGEASPRAHDEAPTGTRRVVIEADGGSRGNPGPAAYGAVLKDADTGRVLAEDAQAIGVASNNVAEYRGLIAGLKLAAELAPEAEIEARLDSKLVVEQMSGNWKIKHPSMRPLALEANGLAPFGTTYTWVPREQNKHADRLANEALDGVRDGVTFPGEEPQELDEESLIEEIESPSAAAAGDPPAAAQAQARGWSAGKDAATTLILVRHGVTAHTVDKRFSGGLAGSNPGLSDDGRDQIRTTGDWLLPLAEHVDVVLTSPVRRTRESAEILAELFDRGLEEEPGFAEMEFGHWDGRTFAEIAEEHGPELDAWLGSLDTPPSGGESFREVEKRVLAGLDRVLADHAGRTVVVVSHVTPIKTLVAHALGAPLDAVFKMELSPASVTVISYFDGGGEDGPRASLRVFNAHPTGSGDFPHSTRW